VGCLSEVVALFAEATAMKRVMVISPHPDDESIGCGGAICGHVASGDTVQLELLTSGEKGGHGLGECETAQTREGEARTAAKILGIANIEFYRQNDGSLSASAELATLLASRLEASNPHLVYIPHPREQHPDHQPIAKLLRRALRRLQNADPPRVLAYEIWTPLQQLDEIVDITPFLERKLEAIAAYASQCRVMDFVEAARGLARYRGEMHSWPGGEYAEVFAELTSKITRPGKTNERAAHK
jgi:LmbE family N-acetylglucosaminyl deacetylase